MRFVARSFGAKVPNEIVPTGTDLGQIALKT